MSGCVPAALLSMPPSAGVPFPFRTRRRSAHCGHVARGNEPVAAAHAWLLTPSRRESAERFLRSLIGPDGSLRAVLKPRRGQESVMVGMATSMAEARAMYDVIAGTAVSIDASEGGAGLGVVAQEYLRGDEWVVDTVSRGGQHKAVAVWRYSKGAANGAPFVNFYDELRAADGALERSLLEYAFAVLDALGWRWGPCHLEIKATPDGPRLVEVNAGRWNGIDFKLVADVALGYNAYDAAVSALLDTPGGDDDLFGAIPAAPAPLRCHARLVKLVSSVSGRLVMVDGLDQIEALESCVHHTLRDLEPGQHIPRTVDLGSSGGLIHLLHADAGVVAADYGVIRAIQPKLFRIEDG